jgi:hypothetical protein
MFNREKVEAALRSILFSCVRRNWRRKGFVVRRLVARRGKERLPDFPEETGDEMEEEEEKRGEMSFFSP